MPETPDQILERFCTSFRFSLERDEKEPHCWCIEQYVLYSPEHEEISSAGAEGWEIWSLTVTPGVHTLPNGDPGYPDEIDQVEVSTHTTIWSALEKLGCLVVRDWVDIEQQAAEFS